MVAFHPQFTSLEGRYAKALYQSLSSPKEADQFIQEGQSFLALLKENKDLKSALMTPLVNRTIQGRILKRIVESSHFSKPLSQCVLLLAKHARLPLMEKVLVSFEAFHRVQQNLQSISIKSAGSSDPHKNPHFEVLTSLIKKAFGPSVDIDYFVDPSLIAGYQIIKDGRVFDASFKTQLKLLQNTTFKD